MLEKTVDVAQQLNDHVHVTHTCKRSWVKTRCAFERPGGTPNSGYYGKYYLGCNTDHRKQTVFNPTCTACQLCQQFNLGFLVSSIYYSIKFMEKNEIESSFCIGNLTILSHFRIALQLTVLVNQNIKF